MDVAIIDEEDEITAYVTIDDVVHGCVWVHYGLDWADIELLCGGKAPNKTRTAANPEPITCLRCLEHEWSRRTRF
jgi:hypothetical protein